MTSETRRLHLELPTFWRQIYKILQTEILPTFDVQHPVDSTSTVWQLLFTNLDLPPTRRQIHLQTSAIMALTYPKKYKKDINLEIWNKAIIDFAKAKPQDLNGFLVYRIVHYTDSKYNDIML